MHVRDDAGVRFDAGLSVYGATMDIPLAGFDSWGDAERIVADIATLCREFGSTEQPGDPLALMAKNHGEHGGRSTRC